MRRLNNSGQTTRDVLSIVGMKPLVDFNASNAAPTGNKPVVVAVPAGKVAANNQRLVLDGLGTLFLCKLQFSGPQDSFRRDIRPRSGGPERLRSRRRVLLPKPPAKLVDRVAFSSRQFTVFRPTPE